MTLTHVTRFTSKPEINLLTEFFHVTPKAHYTIEATVSEDCSDGDYVDSNGVLWSLCMDFPYNTPTKVRLMTIKPVRDLTLSMVYEKV